MSVASDLAEQLADRVDQLVPELLSTARRVGGYWIAGSTDNDVGQSLFVRRQGARVGKWEDRATDQHGDLLDLVNHCACGGRGLVEAIAWARRWLGNERPAVPPRKPRAKSADAEDKAAIAVARRMWCDARPIQGTIGERYLRSRAITIGLPLSLRFLSVATHTPTGALLPTVVAAMSGNDGRVSAILRTYLRLDGSAKATVSAPKMSLGRMRRSACRLAAATTELGLAEGVETALSAMELHKMPVWAACGSRMEAIELPPRLERLIVFGDHGQAGADAVERALAVHARDGLSIEVRLPTTPGCKDWNDQAEIEALRRLHLTGAECKSVMPQ